MKSQTFTTVWSFYAYTLPIGQGNIDFERFFEHICKIKYNGTFTIEATAFDGDGVVDVEMLNKQFGFIRGAIDCE